jgi:ABC-2 type transport system permease protein
VLSLGLLLVTMFVFVWLSARIFRWSMLQYGKTPGLRELVRALRRGDRITTSQPQERADVR